MKIVAVILSVAAAWAQPAVAPPQIGFVQDNAGLVRPLYGVAGNFVLGPSVAGKIVSEAFSGSLGLLKTDSSLAAFNSQGKQLASMNAAPGPALFAFSTAGVTALAYLASSNALIEWNGSAFTRLAADTAGTVLAIAFPAPFEASLIVQRDHTVWQMNGGSQTALMGVHAPLLALPSGDLIYRDGEKLSLRRTNASEVRIAATLPETFSLQQMNRDWVQLTDLNSSARFAIRTTPGREGFYRLPE